MVDAGEWLAETIAGPGGEFVFNNIVLGSGDRVLKTVAYDRAGNLSLASEAVTLTIDVLPPAAPLRVELALTSDHGSLGDDRIARVNAPLSFRIHLAPDAQVGDKVTLRQGTVVLVETTISAGARQQGVVTLNVAGGILAAGNHTNLTARATDASGNIGADQVMPQFTLLAPPNTPASLAFANGLDANGRTNLATGFTLTGTISTVQQIVAVEIFDNIDSNNPLGRAVIHPSDQRFWSMKYTGMPYADGTYNFRAVAIDVAGNRSALTTELWVAFDSTTNHIGTTPATWTNLAPADRPLGIVLRPGSDNGLFGFDSITTDTRPAFRVYLPATVVNGDVIKLFSSNTTAVSALVAEHALSSLDRLRGYVDVPVVDSKPLANGTYSAFNARLQNANNVLSPQAFLQPLIVDLVVPLEPSAPSLRAADDTGSNSADGITTRSSGFTLQGTVASATLADQVNIYINGQLAGSASVIGTSTAWVWTHTGTPLSDGQYVVTVRAVDAAGNESATSAPLILSVDPQALNPMTGLQGSMILSNANGFMGNPDDGTINVWGATVGLQGYMPANTTVWVYRDGGAQADQLIGSVMANAQGAFSLTGVALVEGVNVLRAYAIAADGTTVSQALLTVVSDQSMPLNPPGPPVLITNGAIDRAAITNDTTPTFRIGLASDAVAGDVVILRNGAIEIARTVLTSESITAKFVDLTVRADAALATGVYANLRASLVDQTGVEGLASVARWVEIAASSSFGGGVFEYAELSPGAGGYAQEVDRILTNVIRPSVRIHLGGDAVIGDQVRLHTPWGVVKPIDHTEPSRHHGWFCRSATDSKLQQYD